VKKNKIKNKEEKANRTKKDNSREEIDLEFDFSRQLHKTRSHPFCIDEELSQMRHFRLNAELELNNRAFEKRSNSNC